MLKVAVLYSCESEGLLYFTGFYVPLLEPRNVYISTLCKNIVMKKFFFMFCRIMVCVNRYLKFMVIGN